MIAIADHRHLQRKIRILVTVQKYCRLSASKAVSWSHIRGSEGMRAVDELVGNGFLVKQANGGQGLGCVVTLSEKGAGVLRKYSELLSLVEAERRGSGATLWPKSAVSQGCT